jgi:hypothetical protein
VQVALVLAAAAVAAALVGARVSYLSGVANGSWQSTVRLEVKRSISVVESERYLYQVELPSAVEILRIRLVLQELETAAATATGSTKQALIAEIDVQTEILKVLEHGSILAAPTYALPSGGLDLGRRLADLRADYPNIVALDPLASRRAGDDASSTARALTFGLLPISLCAFVAALAQAWARRRKVLLQCGLVSLAVGVAMTLGVELL